MPIDFVPRDRMVSGPRSGALKDAWNQQLKAYGKNPGSMLGGFGEFEDGQTVKVESGRVEFNANEIMAGIIKQPAYALEAPLRPLNVATGGAVGDALTTAWGVGKSLPVLGLAFNALEGVGGVLEASNKAGKAFLNYTLAEHLRQSRGKPDNWTSSFMGETLTAGEVRKRVMDRWSVDPMTGETYSLAQLEARAAENTMNFGDFNVHENGALNFGAQILADPINLAMLGSGTLVGLTGKAIKAAPWARPAVNLGTRMAGAPRIGIGALKYTGRVVTQTPAGAKFMDEFNSARAILNGTLREHGTLAGMLRATSWAMRGIYVPGYTAARAQGRGVLRAGSTAYIRGGMQQQIATNAAEQLAGMSGGWMQDKGLDTNVQDGFTSWVHDALNKINNDHPLSDYEGFVVASLFSPWASAIGNARTALKVTRTKQGLPAYADNTLREVKDNFRREFGVNAKYDDMFKAMGKGDIAAGKAAWEWFVDQADVIKAGNQLSSFTRQIAEADDIAMRTQFLTQTAVQKVQFLREKAALQPKSTADFMIDMLRNGPKDVAGETLAAQMSITPEVFYNFVGQSYRANLQHAPQLAKLGGVQLEQGAPITRELLDAVIEQLDALPPSTLIDRDMAAQIMAAGPSLVWESEFFSRFASTLGQRQPGGRFRRASTEAENVTNAQVRERLVELRESAPPAAELFHEAVAAAKNSTRIKPGETLLSEPPYPLPTKLEARRVYNTGRVRQLIRTMNTLRDTRNAEFFKNGKPRIKAAKELSGHEGGLFRRAEDAPNMMRRDDGMAFTVEDGVIRGGTEGFPMSLDSEALVLGAQNGGRTIVFPRAEGQFLADHGFVEVAAISGSDNAAFAFRGGDVTKIVENGKAGAFAPYRPTTRIVASEATALKVARKTADSASITDPSTWATRISKDARHMNPDERLKELNRLRDQADAERRSLMKQISESDRLAMELAGIDMKVAKLGDWFNAASKTEVDNMVQLVKDVNRDYPAMSVREGQGLWVDPRADRFSTLLTQRSLARRMAFDYGFLSPLNFLYTALAAPVNARYLGKQAQTEMHNLLAQSGFSAKESKKFAELLRKEVIDSRSVEGTLGERTGAHMYRTVRAIPEGKIVALLEEAATGKSKEVMARWGTGQRMITEASNRMQRNAATRGRGGGRVDPLSRALNSAFRVWQYTPGLMPISSATHELTKFLYPLLRFKADPFYHAMNLLEPDMYGISMEGAKASRWSKGIVNRAQSQNAAEQASVTSIPPGGLVAKDVPMDVLMADTGAYTMPRSIRPIMERHFDIKRFDSADDVWRALKSEDPAARVMVEHFGDDVEDWVKAGDEMMYGYMTKGPEATVMDGARSVLEDMGISLDEAKHLVPHIERLASAHRGQYNDLVQLYIGRMNRPGIERLLDNFWLMWPLSYQIKATTWLATIMFKRIGGVNLGMAPAAMWTEYRERFEQSMEGDYEFKNWVENNDAFLFALEMVFPMTPQGIGASLSRPTRYVGSWIADGLEIPDDIKEQFLGNYPQVRTIPELLENSIIVGPARTERLFKRIMDRFEVPGFTTPEEPSTTLPELPR